MKKDYIYYINGNFIKAKDAKISFNDGGFQRGNAIFETIRFNKNHLFYIDSHMKRLQDGITYLEFKEAIIKIAKDIYGFEGRITTFYLPALWNRSTSHL